MAHATPPELTANEDDDDGERGLGAEERGGPARRWCRNTGVAPETTTSEEAASHSLGCLLRCARFPRTIDGTLQSRVLGTQPLPEYGTDAPVLAESQVGFVEPWRVRAEAGVRAFFAATKAPYKNYGERE